MSHDDRCLKIDVTSDVLCPFCLLGMKQLELAIEKYRQTDPTLRIEIHMHPFQLNGLITETPIKRQEFGERKFGKARWDAINASLVEKFKSVGIDFEPDSYMSSSHLAHRLAALCADRRPEADVALAMDLYEMHHVRGIHSSDKKALAEIAVKHKLFDNEEQAVAWLNSSEYDLQVKKCYQKAQQNGITGVPFFVFQDKYAASGAMGVDEFVQILSEVSRREKSLSPPPLQVSADTCPVNSHDDACRVETHAQPAAAKTDMPQQRAPTAAAV